MMFSVTKKDFEITWFSGTGAGGQARNKNQNCLRLKHIATGVIKTGQSNRDRPSNQREALAAMADDPFFKAHCEKKLRELEDGESLEEKVEREMAPENLKVEVRGEDGKWVEEEPA